MSSIRQTLLAILLCLIISNTYATTLEKSINANKDFTIALWVKTNTKSNTYPAIASNKQWEDGKEIDLISTSNMGKTLATGSNQGWTLAIQPNGAWLWNIGNGKSRLDYLPTAKHQPINDNQWHHLAFTINHDKNTAHLYYDGKNVAIYSTNGFSKLNKNAHIKIGSKQLTKNSDLTVQTSNITQTKLTTKQIFNLYKQKFPNAKQNIPTSKVENLKVLAWNIWHGARHPGTEKGITQAVDFIKSTGADVITMQETYGSGPIIADRLGYYFYLRSSNLSVMSKYPIIETHDLYQPFRFGGVTLKLAPKQNVNVFSLWIHYLPAWRSDAHAKNATVEKILAGEWKTRASELKAILKTLKPFIDKSDKTPLIVGGDFNSPSTLDWTNATKHLNNNLVVPWPVSKQMLDTGFTDTYRAIHPDPLLPKNPKEWDTNFNKILSRIDYIYTHGNGIQTLDSKMFNTHNNTWASDHPAVLSTLRLGKPQLGIISYNILEGFRNKASSKFPSGATRKQMVTHWIAQQNPTFTALQELNGYNQQKLQHDSKKWQHPHAAILKDTGYSVGLTSKFPITIIEKRRKDMHHGYLHARTAGIEVFVIHLSPFKYKHRQKEADIILAKTKKLIKQGKPVVILGDFNAYSPNDKSVLDADTNLLKSRRASDKRYSHVTNLNNNKIDYTVIQKFLDADLIDPYAKHRKFKKTNVPPRIDYILVSPNLAKRYKDAQWHNSKSYDQMSDHPPVSLKFNRDEK